MIIGKMILEELVAEIYTAGESKIIENICGKEVYCSTKSVEVKKKRKYSELRNTQ